MGCLLTAVLSFVLLPRAVPTDDLCPPVGEADERLLTDESVDCTASGILLFETDFTDADTHPATAVDGEALLRAHGGHYRQVRRAEGDAVEAGDLVVVVGAMKMEQPSTPPRPPPTGAVVVAGTRTCVIV
jgi:acetyl/propionyl-CoA carboxylase alpha subunit